MRVLSGNMGGLLTPFKATAPLPLHLCPPENEGESDVRLPPHPVCKPPPQLQENLRERRDRDTQGRIFKTFFKFGMLYVSG